MESISVSEYLARQISNARAPPIESVSVSDGVSISVTHVMRRISKEQFDQYYLYWCNRKRPSYRESRSWCWHKLYGDSIQTSAQFTSLQTCIYKKAT